jgi:hypothetical protein
MQMMTFVDFCHVHSLAPVPFRVLVIARAILKMNANATKY